MLKTIVKSAALAAALLCSTAISQAAAAPTPPTADAFARVPALDSVTISPDGKHIAAITSPDGERTFVTVWATDAMDKPPVMIPTAKAKAQRFESVRFVKNNRLAVTFRQLFEYSPGGGGIILTHTFKTILMSFEPGGPPPAYLLQPRKTSEVENWIDEISNGAIIDNLPRDPSHVLVVDGRLKTSGDILKVDVYTGAAEKISHGSDKYGDYETDLKGELRARQYADFDKGKFFIAQEIKNPDTGAWEEHFRWYAKDREPVSIAAFTEDPNIVLVRSGKGRDKAAIYEYDIRQKKFLGPAFEHKLFEAGGVIQSFATSDYGRVLGFTYSAEAGKRYWIDDKLGSTEEALRKALGVKTTIVDWVDPATNEKSRFQTADGFDVYIMGHSDDLKYMLVEKSGPTTPPEYYLLTDGNALQLLGKSRPQIDPAALGETHLVEYQARDGLMIPAMLTTPPKSVFGEGPYPAIVLPHGGPWSRDDLDWDFSGWTQYFAARGYVVIQPQFRGSEGWGQKLWRAGDAEWGQKMQDDNDDAAKWLVANKFAAPDRIALHGYSYGGYAAFAAGVRPNGLYQCAIAGAGVAELTNFQGETFDNRFQREFQRPTIAGLDPIKHVSEVSIPMLVYHGVRDQTVEVKESRRFVEGLKNAGKPHKYVELPDMGHQYVLWSPANHKAVLETIENYLKTDCGPGGL
jgi:dipeptidyl aminopeptidase/acylaminoacyl peptidase